MKFNRTRKKKRLSSLHQSIRDGKAYAVVLGTAETYTSAFAVFLGATTLQIGVISTLPPLIGSILQSLAVWLTDTFRNRRRIIVTAAYCDALVLLATGLLCPFLKSTTAVSVLILLSSLHYLFAGIILPPWNSLLGDLVPAHRRGYFFGIRNTYVNIFIFVSMVSLGQILHWLKIYGWEAAGFALLFLVAGVARCISAHALSQHREPKYSPDPSTKFSFYDFLRRAPHSNFAKFVFFHAGIFFGVAIAGPYFAEYMLRDLQLSYVEFMIVTAGTTLPQFLVYRRWGLLSDAVGSKKILQYCSYGVAIVPFLWLFSSNIGFLILIQVYSGIMWAGYNLAVQSFLFDAVQPSKRARCAAYQSIVAGVAVFVGSMLGGKITAWLPDIGPHLAFGSTKASPLLLLFLLSGLIRLIAVSYFLPRFKEVREVSKRSGMVAVPRLAHIRPLLGAKIIFIPARKGKSGIAKHETRDEGID